MRRILFYSILTAIVLWSCQRDIHSVAGEAQLQISFQHYIDAAPFALNTSYTNHFGEAFTINKFKYYISNIELWSGNSSTLMKDTYFLIDEANATSKNIQLNIPPGNYSGISFLIGVDSLHNVSGAQSGALDPTNGMFWTWNTGYIMAKMEGTSPVSPLPNQKIEYHIGGFAAPNNALRRVQFHFDNAVNITDKNDLHIDISANLQKWFDGPNAIRIADNAGTMTPGNLANKIADNYSAMFALTSAQTQ